MILDFIMISNKVKPTIESISESRVYFVDNTVDNYDAIILATGYKSTIMKWLHLVSTWKYILNALRSI